MPPALTQEQREQITASLFRREPCQDIAKTHNISERQVRRISQCLRQYGTVAPPKTKKQGRPRSLNDEIEEDLRKYVADRPLAQLEDMQAHIQETFNVKCSRASLSRRMKDLGYTRGIVRRGYRSRQQEVPLLSHADMVRLMADPSPDQELANLPGNSKRAKYAWLLTGVPWKGDAKKDVRGLQSLENASPILQDSTPSPNRAPPSGTYHTPVVASTTAITPTFHATYGETTTYVSPYRTVTSNGGLVIGAPTGANPHPVHQDEMHPLSVRVHSQHEFSQS